ncbi:MAG: hypothetical protein J4F43_05945 [Dehalococcoidia bacterium]|nr:hypothetical protein [Dehalococcoidia bacterium]
MARKLGILALLPLFAAAAFAGVYFSYYRGGYDEPAPGQIPYHQITSPSVASGGFVDSPTAQVRRGLLLVDALHRNAFSENELVTLSTRVANRGYDVEFIGAFDYFERDGRLPQLEEKLRRADSLAVIVPQAPYSDAEAALVERFVRKGGKLLLVSDPTRQEHINTLAERFGLSFQPDYLYNMKEYDLNFQNIIIREFQPHELTSGVDAITLYTAGSIRSSGPGLAFPDSNTRSSLVDTTEGLHPIAWGDRRNVLAIADFTFLIPPHNSLLDNDRLVSNIADYLTSSEREYELADFPHFYEVGPEAGLDILLGEASLWDIGVEMKNGLAAYGMSARIRGTEDLSRDTVFLGLYDDALPMSRYLQAAGVRIDDTLGTPFAPDLDLEGTSVTVLDQNQDRHVLVVLADTSETLAGAAARLLVGEFRGDLVSDFVGVSK